MELNTFRVVVLISVFSVLIPVSVYFIRLRNLPQQNHHIGLLILISAVFDCVNYIQFTKKLTNQWSANLYNIVLFCLLARFFHSVVFSIAYRKIFYTGLIVYAVVVIVDSCFVENFVTQYQSMVWVTGGLTLCVYCYMYHLFVSAGSTHVIFNPHLHSELSIVGGIFIYFSFSVVIFIFMNYIMTNLDAGTSRMVWSIHNANNIIKNIFFAFGIYLSGKRAITITKQEYEIIVARQRKNLSKDPSLN